MKRVEDKFSKLRKIDDDLSRILSRMKILAAQDPQWLQNHLQGTSGSGTGVSSGGGTPPLLTQGSNSSLPPYQLHYPNNPAIPQLSYPQQPPSPYTQPQLPYTPQQPQLPYANPSYPPPNQQPQYPPPQYPPQPHNPPQYPPNPHQPHPYDPYGAPQPQQHYPQQQPYPIPQQYPQLPWNG